MRKGWTAGSTIRRLAGRGRAYGPRTPRERRSTPKAAKGPRARSCTFNSAPTHSRTDEGRCQCEFAIVLDHTIKRLESMPLWTVGILVRAPIAADSSERRINLLRNSAEGRLPMWSESYDQRPVIQSIPSGPLPVEMLPAIRLAMLANTRGNENGTTSPTSARS
jgi:hypothetical protein